MTFIMPAYNVEKYLAQAIESVLAQTERDWKMIIVDDCSSDHTYAIAEDYSRRDRRIRVMKTESQSGCVYIPRKLAIIAADTDIVAPLDADDAIEPAYLSHLLNTMKREGSDIVYPVMYAWDGKRRRELMSVFDRTLLGKTISGTEALENTLNGWRIHCNGGLIRKDIYLRGFKIVNENDEGIVSYIDEYLTRVLLSNARKVSIMEECYFYRENPNSITHKLDIKAFGQLSNNIRIVDFIQSRYTIDSKAYLRAQCQNFYGVYDAMRLLRKILLTREEKAKVKDLIKMSISKVNNNLLGRNVSGKYYAFSRILFRLPVNVATMVLELADRILRK